MQTKKNDYPRNDNRLVDKKVLRYQNAVNLSILRHSSS